VRTADGVTEGKRGRGEGGGWEGKGGGGGKKIHEGRLYSIYYWLGRALTRNDDPRLPNMRQSDIRVSGRRD